MDFFNLIGKRRSVRKYQNRPVEPEKVALIVEAALRAPSSRDLNPWEFIVVDDPKTIRELSRAKQHGSAFLQGAPLAVIVCADPEKCDVWIEDAAIAAVYISLAAEALGLGNCWIQIREREHGAGKTAEEFVREVLRIPQSLKVESIIAIGYPDEEKPGHSREELQYGKVFINGFGQK
jgi:nitroreductase